MIFGVMQTILFAASIPAKRGGESFFSGGI